MHLFHKGKIYPISIKYFFSASIFLALIISLFYFFSLVHSYKIIELCQKSSKVYAGEIKKRGIPDERNIKKSFTSKQNQPIMRKARDPTKIQVEIKSAFGKSPIISKTSINTQQESKEIFRMKILEKDDEIYEKIHPKIA